MKQEIIYGALTIFAVLLVNWGTNDNIARVNKRIDYLYTERGFNELKCKAAGGELVDFYQVGLDQDSKFVSSTKHGCFRESISKEEVEIKI